MRSPTFGVFFVLFSIGFAQKAPPPPCLKDADCRVSHLPKDAKCIDGICICGDQDANCTRPTPKNAESKPVESLIHRTCVRDGDCNVNNGICNTQRRQCECSPGFIPSTNGKACLAIVDVGSTCDEDKQCNSSVSNTICIDKTCVCANGYHYDANICWKNVDYGYPCNKTQNCTHITGAVCTIDGVCECLPKSVINSDGQRCLESAARYLDECEESTQCETTFRDSMCINKRCECPADYHFAPIVSRCVINRSLGDKCETSHECYQGEDEYGPKALHCLNNYCECAAGFYATEDETKCTSSANKSVISWVPFTLLTGALYVVAHKFLTR